MKTNKKEQFFIDHIVEELKRGLPTHFLNRHEYALACSALKKQNLCYQVWESHAYCDKVILYRNRSPKVICLAVISSHEFTHSEVLGSLFGLNLNASMFGDILYIDGTFYLLVISSIASFVAQNLCFIGRNPVRLQSVSLDITNSYQRKRSLLEFGVASTRIDAVIAKLIGLSRKSVLEKIKTQSVFVNDCVLENCSYGLKEGDVFSIRKYGKYRYIGTVGETKKGKIRVQCERYII